MKLNININDIAQVKLTSYGLTILNNHYNHLGLKPTGLNENILETSVWDSIYNLLSSGFFSASAR